MMKEKKMTLHYNKSNLLTLISIAKFRPFDDADWDAFSGCDSPNPRIAEIGEYVLIIDGSVLSVIRDGYSEMYELQEGVFR